MRKALASLIALGLVASFSMSPALAGKKKAKKKVTKTIEETIDVTAVPFPNYSSYTATATPGCTAGVEGVHKATRSFETPGAGTLTLSMSGFTGDWDLYVFDGAVAIARSDNEQVGPTMAPAEEKIEMPLEKGKTYDLVVCNWAGAPQASAQLKYVYSL
ncbi:MAG TPA: hypothetical protein VHN37_11880 [Actinomycetota bacterium]|nr:hypothetical protein [Actinomycetota bacterium]